MAGRNSISFNLMLKTRELLLVCRPCKISETIFVKMESCGMSVIKYLLFGFNLIFAISGIGIIVAGAVVLVDVGEYSHFMESRILVPPIVLIVAGAVVFIVAFLGCFGAMKEKPSTLITFAVCLAIILIIELAVGITAAVYKSEFEQGLTNNLKNSMQKYSNGNERLIWDNLQTKLKCCGVTGAEDWRKSGHLTPLSCCTRYSSQSEEDCRRNNAGTSVYTVGCYDKIRNKVNANATVLIGVGIGIAFIEVVGIILACWLAYTIKREAAK